MLTTVRSFALCALLTLACLFNGGCPLEVNQMLPNINLESGQPVAMDLTYTPAAAEVIYPCEGNLALAVQAPSDETPNMYNGDLEAPITLLLPVQQYVDTLCGKLNGIYRDWFRIGTEASSQAWMQSDGRLNASTPTGQSLAFTICQVLNLQDKKIRSLTFQAGGDPDGTAQLMCFQKDAQEPTLLAVASASIVSGENTLLLDFTPEEEGYLLAIIFQCGISHKAFWVDDISANTDMGVLIITAMQTSAGGTRLPASSGPLYSGPMPENMILIPLDPALYGLGRPGQRLGMVEFEVQGGRGLEAIRAAVVRWSDPR